MNGLEVAYRRALRWYPRSWRDENGEALLGTMLDAAEHAGRSEARWSNLNDIRLNGARARLAQLDLLLPSSVRDRASSVAFGFGAGLAVTMLVIQEWAPWATPLYVPLSAPVGPFHGWGGVLYSVWGGALLLVLVGLRTPARWLIAATLPFSIVLVVMAPAYDASARPTSLGLGILGSLALITVLGRPRRLPLLGAAVIAAVGVVVPFAMNVPWTWLVPPAELWRMAVYGSGFGGALIVVLLALATVAIAARAWSWLGAVAVLSAPWFLVSLTSLFGREASAGVTAALVVLTAAVVLSIVRLRLRGFRLVLVRQE